MIVHRDMKPATASRPVTPGDVVRDRDFKTAIDRVTRIEDGVVYLADDGSIPARVVHLAYEHADGAPIQAMEKA